MALLCFVLRLLVAPFRSTSRLAAENAVLQHQLVALQRKVRGRVEFTNGDRLFFILLYRWFPSILKAITIVQPETVVRWHRPVSVATGDGSPASRAVGANPCGFAGIGP